MKPNPLGPPNPHWVDITDMTVDEVVNKLLDDKENQISYKSVLDPARVTDLYLVVNLLQIKRPGSSSSASTDASASLDAALRFMVLLLLLSMIVIMLIMGFEISALRTFRDCGDEPGWHRHNIGDGWRCYHEDGRVKPMRAP
jgi:hypothetical protein